ncbi:V-type ATPase V1 subunit C [Schizosaccharomyces cryophilus OY26]|uniref:V-type proton ATPase subunit C n=1 Tax=Schizosaccharomyces cryophilus (strain OY26 / ATCC MYA-4695 / CBS 11777 / NBRC 106824 / NRRL Y48691) TaxID=653667 RepID=S9XHN5_SCHCR|nr:V-type ATPase V1 subunit C [Schizosaccharomyces cryophilus OY26]EPY53191.1 V-type ATPase V1 subunit C [Schizosaccharomyces cryophilus OY26]
MSQADFWILSIPSNGGSNSDLQDDLEYALVSGSTKLIQIVSPFNVPLFKVESLDVLINQNEQLAKQDTQCSAALSKTTEVIKSLVSTSSEELKDYFLVDGRTPLEYITSFQWNASRFRLSKSITDLSQSLTSEALALENDIRSRQTNFQQASSAYQSIQKKKSGNLSQRSLASIVRKEDVIVDSDYMTNIFIAVPLNAEKKFLSSYETLTNLVIPRSAQKLDQDEEFALYTVIVFKRSAEEFTSKLREQRYTVRDFTFESGLRETEQTEFDNAAEKEKHIRSSLLRYAKIAFSEIFQHWVHLKCLLVYVESVLRYGLPPDFSSVVFQPIEKADKKIKALLNQKYSYLEQNTSRNSKASDDMNASLDESMAGLNLHEEYLPYVLFTVPTKSFNY